MTYYSQLEYLTDEDFVYVQRTLYKLCRWDNEEIEKSMRWGLVISMYREAFNMSNKASAKKWYKEPKVNNAPMGKPIHAPMVAPMGTHKVKERKVKENKVKEDNIKEVKYVELVSEISIAPKVATLESHIKKNFDADFIKDIYEKYPIKKEEFHEECNFFLAYWKEKSPTWKKERWEKEKVFDPKLRFRTWMRNNEKWGTTKIINYSEDERQKKLAEIERKKKLLFG